MGPPIKLRWSQSAPNLFFDWNNLSEFVFEDPKFGESWKKKKSFESEDRLQKDVNQVGLGLSPQRI